MHILDSGIEAASNGSLLHTLLDDEQVLRLGFFTNKDAAGRVDFEFFESARSRGGANLSDLEKAAWSRHWRAVTHWLVDVPRRHALTLASDEDAASRRALLEEVLPPRWPSELSWNADVEANFQSWLDEREALIGSTARSVAALYSSPLVRTAQTNGLQVLIVVPGQRSIVERLGSTALLMSHGALADTDPVFDELRRFGRSGA